MKRLTTLVLLCGLLAGCNSPLMPGAGPSGNQAVEPVGALQFKPISPDNAQLLGNAAGASAAESTRASAPMPAPAATSAPMAPGGTGMAGGAVSADAAKSGIAFSGNMHGAYYAYGGYHGGSGEPMALVSITQAEAPGEAGSFQQVLKTVVNPVLPFWAQDARLIQSSATLASDGAAPSDAVASSDRMSVTPMPGGYYGSEPGWRLTYLSTSRHEIMHFFVTPAKTLVLRQRFAPLDLRPDAVAVDSTSAVKSLIDAIQNPDFKGEEEKTGLDYFLGSSFQQAGSQPSFGGGRTETLHEVPANARWNVTLRSVLGRLVWELSYYAHESPVASPGGMTDAGAPEPAPTKPEVAPAAPAYWTHNGASGMVDAVTGTVIRFSRPYRQYYQQPDAPRPVPLPMPAPSATPSAAP